MKKIYIIIFLLFIIPFQLFAQKPVITSFSPASGIVGSNVIIEGSNFSADTGKNIVMFGQVKVRAISGTATRLTVVVPAGAMCQPIAVTNKASGLTGYSAKPFYLKFSPYYNTMSKAQTFGPVNTKFGKSPVGIAAANFDSGERMDLAIADSAAKAVYICWPKAKRVGSYASGDMNKPILTLACAAGPTSITVADINGDGKPDIIVTNYTTNSISIFPNISTPPSGTIQHIAFGARVDITTGTNPVAVNVGDIDGDGIPDIAVANAGSNSISVIRKVLADTISPAAFAPKIDIGTSGTPKSVLLYDVDGDGKPDLLNTNSNQNTFSIFHNVGTAGSITAASFAAKVDFATGTGPRSIAAGDLNGDGKPEIVIANTGSNTVSLYKNTAVKGSISSSSLDAPINLTTGTAPVWVAIDNITGDDRPDIITADYTSNTFTVFNNSVNLRGIIKEEAFSSKTTLPTSPGPRCFAITDINSDGEMDIVSIHPSGMLSVIVNSIPSPPVPTGINPASGSKNTAVKLTGPSFGDYPSSESTADDISIFFGASKATTVTKSPSSNSIYYAMVPFGVTNQPMTICNIRTHLTAILPPFNVISDNTNAAFAPKVDFPTASGPASVAFGDFTGTGKLSMIVATAGENTISIYPNNVADSVINIHSFGPKIALKNNLDPTGVAVADLNGDGKLDIVVTNSLRNMVSVYYNTSAATTITFADRVDFRTGASPQSVAVGDIDGDGLIDIVVANQGSNSVSVLRNTGGGQFAPRLDLTVGDSPIAVKLADIDGDGKPDIICANYAANSISIIRNGCPPTTIISGYFSDKVDFGVGVHPQSIDIADLNGDGKPDIAVANNGSNTISIFQNSATKNLLNTSSLKPKFEIATANSPVSVLVTDVTSDGLPEIMVANKGSNNATVYLNKTTSGSFGPASFSSTLTLAAGTNPQAIFAGDIDGDGRQDIIVSNTSAATVSLFKNISTSVVAPVISSFSPVSGPAGSIVTINGSGFNSSASSNIVTFGAVKGKVNTASDTQLTVIVPQSTTYEPLSVINTKTMKAGYSKNPFIQTFSPSVDTLATNDFNPYLQIANTTQNTIPFLIGSKDIDADGKPDMITYDGSDTIKVYPNISKAGVIGNSSFGSPTPVVIPFITYGILNFTITDMDLDGKPDIIGSTVNELLLFHNTTSTKGKFIFTQKNYSLSTNTNLSVLKTADMDGDGRPDIIGYTTASYYTGPFYMIVYKNNIINGSLTDSDFKVAAQIRIPYPESTVALADIDGDGLTDIINQKPDTLLIYRNTSVSGVITFADPVIIPHTGTSSVFTTIADIDGDGKPDLIGKTSTPEEKIVVIQNLSTPGNITNASFGTPVLFTTGGYEPVTSSLGTDYTINFAIGDINGDGKPDIVAGTQYPYNLLMLANNAVPETINSSSFAPPAFLPTPNRASRINIVDIDGDGKADLLAKSGDFSPGIAVGIFRNIIGEISANTNSLINKAAAAQLNSAPIVNVYPNPTPEDINFTLSNYSGNAITTTLTNLDGKVINTGSFQAGSSSYKLNLSQKPERGVYILHINGQNLSVTKKVVVQ